MLPHRALIALLACGSIAAQDLAPFDRSEPVAPGIVYRERRFYRGELGPFTMQILMIDPREPSVNLLPVRALDRAIGRERTTAMAERYGAIAAINGGFFVTRGVFLGSSAYPYALEGQVVSGGPSRAALLFCEEKKFVEDLRIATVNFQGAVRMNGESWPLRGVNQERAEGSLMLYTARMGPSTLTAGDGYEVAVNESGRVVETGASDLAIPPGGSVISGSGPAAIWLRRNVRRSKRVRVQAALRQKPETCRATDVLGAGPRLVEAGKVVAPANPRHPRTAAARKADGTLLLVTLDGRQKISIGMTLAELAEELVSMGAMEAINLDGGGSTTMVVKGRVRNSPSDGAERPVGDAVLVFSAPDRESAQRIQGSVRAREEAEKSLRR
ncbi:MAG: phosphodiester glycosidase family protein [Bryobacteraceae bacterium]|nr:phosphodiester glycosidase family protein [Bryobacteraceae bacterium]